MPTEGLDISKNPNKQFLKYVDEAIKECQQLSFTEKTQGLWGKSEILKYLTELPVDEPTKYLATTLKEILPNMEKKKILCVGGGTGRLGRYIASTNLNSSVLEIDTSSQMVEEANKLAESNSQNNFVSAVGDARTLPFMDDEYDYALAYGVFRYINEKDQQKVVDEMLRVSKYGAMIAEGKAKDIMYSLRDAINPKFLIKETQIPMFRMSLFYMLLKKYENDQQFQILVDNKSKNKPVELLSQLAGTSEGTLYELRLKSNH